MAMDTAIDGLTFLHSVEGAVRAEAALVKPVSISFEGIFGGGLIDRDIIMWGKGCFSIVPRFTFDLEEFNVATVGCVSEEGVSKFM